MCLCAVLVGDRRIYGEEEVGVSPPETEGADARGEGACGGESGGSGGARTVGGGGACQPPVTMDRGGGDISPVTRSWLATWAELEGILRLRWQVWDVMGGGVRSSVT